MNEKTLFCKILPQVSASPEWEINKVLGKNVFSKDIKNW